MQDRQQKCQSLTQATATDDLLVVALEQLEIECERAESWREQVEQLKQELQELKQELRYTNQDLCDALLSQGLQFEAMKQLAQRILTTNASRGESLAQMLSAIYHRVVKPEELEQVAQSSLPTESSIGATSHQTVDHARENREYSQQLRNQYKKFGFRFIAFKSNFQRLQQLIQSTNQIREEKVTDCEINKISDRGGIRIPFKGYESPFFS